MGIDSHLKQITYGQVILGGVCDLFDEGWQLTLRTQQGIFRLTDCQLLDRHGDDLLESSDVNLAEIMQNALITESRSKGGWFSFTILKQEGTAQLRGRNAHWSNIARPAINVITGWAGAVGGIKACGCVINKRNQIIEYCAVCSGNQKIPIPLVDDMETIIEAGECSDCGEILEVLGYFVFSECSCIKD